MDELHLYARMIGFLGGVPSLVGTGIGWVLQRWPTKMTQDFASVTLGVFSALSLAAFVELFTSLRKGVEDRSRVEKLHSSGISRSVAAFNADRAPDLRDKRDMQVYFKRIAHLRSRHKVHVSCWAFLSAMLAVSIGLLLQWSSLDEPKGDSWDRYLPNACKVLYLLSVLYFVAVSAMRINLERRISRWEQRAKLAAYFQVPDTESVFDLEKRWRDQMEAGPARPEVRADPETPTRSPETPGRRSRARTARRSPLPDDSPTQNPEP